MRGAIGILHLIAANIGVSIPAPHAGSDLVGADAQIDGWISIPAPHEGSDKNNRTSRLTADEFQSPLPMRGSIRGYIAPKWDSHFNARSPCRGAIGNVRHILILQALISIPAPREGSDRTSIHPPASSSHFNPRSP